jgi:uncharacterized protein with NRDE domain
MCIILFAYEAHPKYKLILAANRDEYFARRTARAAMWEDSPNVVAGRDLERGGTWLGVTKEGRYAAVTNFRDPSAVQKSAPSRGFLVSDFLRSSEPPSEYVARTSALSKNYNGFNLIVGDEHGLHYHSNRDPGMRTLSTGVYGLSNHLLDTPWPKVERGKQALSEFVRRGEKIIPESIFNILGNREQAKDNQLPDTGIGVEYERALSPIFISTPIYGTRSSSLLLIDREGLITFIERTFDTSEDPEDSVFRFQSAKS